MQAIYFERDILKRIFVRALKPLNRRIAFSPMSPVRIGDIPKPDLPGPRWVRLRNKISGICAAAD